MIELIPDLPPGFKMTELGPLPQEWEVVLFDNVVLNQRPKVGKVKQQDYKPIGRFPIIDQGQSYIGGYWDDERDIYHGSLPTIIFGDHTRIFKFVDSPFACGADGTKILLPNTNKCDPKFLFFAFLNLDLPNRGYNRHFSLLRNQKLLLPSLPEQQAIAHVLSTIQRSVETQDKIITAARELKKSLMRHLFTYGPVPLDQADQVTLKETEIGLMPEHWEVVKLGIAAEVIMGQSPPGDSYNNNGIGVPLINGPAEFGGRFPKVFKSTSKPTKICEIGDILFCVRGNTTGRMNVADSKYCIGRGVAAIRGKQSCSQTSYLFYFLEREEQSILSRASAGGSTFPNITKAQLEGLITLHPPLTEQQKIACILSSVDHKIEVEEKKKLSLQVLFKTMLHLLMTGQVRINSNKM